MSAALILARSSPCGCIGCGNLAGPNMTSTGTGPFTSSGRISIIFMSTAMAG
ncbi:MAG: hypothetical protein WDN06_04880 [Asticcacaulis sp.]